MSTRAAIRAWLTTQDGPRWSCEIVAALHAQGIRCRSTAISGMVDAGALVKHDAGPGLPYSYSVGVVPEKADPAASAARRLERERARSKGRNRRPLAVQPAVKRRALAVVKVSDKGRQSMGQTVAEFRASGGVVQVLAGFTGTIGYLPRRPAMNSYRSAT